MMANEIDNEQDPNAFAYRAMLKGNSNKVLSIVNVPSTFIVKGYTFIKIQEGVYCQAGMYYCEKTGLFYDDEEFTSINGISVVQTDSAGQAESAS